MKTRAFLLTILSLSSLSLSACGPSRENFYGAFAEAMCEKWEECLEDDFEDYTDYEDADECIDEAMEDEDDFTEEIVEDDDCEYDKDKASDCIKAIKDVDCGDDEEDFIEDLNDAYEECEFDDIFDCD